MLGELLAQGAFAFPVSHFSVSHHETQLSTALFWVLKKEKVVRP